MPGNWVNFLYFDDGINTHEIINGARTLEHLRNSSQSCGSIQVVNDDCPVLYLDPCDYTPVTFTTPDDPTNPAPWWDGVAGSPTSKAYGFLIDEWTGLDGAHMSRDATPVRRKGSVFGSLGQAHRVWKMNVSLFAADQVALEALFRWLEDALISCCQTGVTAWVRTVCPEGYDDDEGLVHVVDLQILEGLQWEGEAVNDLSCKVRRVSFTLGVGDPCLYRPPVTCYDNEPFATNSLVVTSTGADEVAASQSIQFDNLSNMEIVWAGILDSYSGAQWLVTQGDGSAPGIGFRLGQNGGVVMFSVTLDDAFRDDYYSYDVSIPDYVTFMDRIVPGKPIWIKVKTFREPYSITHIINSVKFYTSLDGADWEELGPEQFTNLLSDTRNPFVMTNAPVQIGALAGASTAAGTHLYAHVRHVPFGDDILGDGLPVVRFNPEDSGGASSWTDPLTGLDWTLGASGVALVDEGDVDVAGHGLSSVLGCTDNSFAPWRRCCNVEGVPVGATAPVVILRNLHPTRDSGPFRVRGVLQTGDCADLHEANLDFGEVRISYIPPQSMVMIDCARERILWRPEGGEHRWEPGYAYLDQDPESVPSYPAIGCFDGMIYVEPAAITPVLDDVYLTVFLVGRYGCC